MRVVNHLKWRRTKIAVCIALFITALICAGGLESSTPDEPVPSVLGFLLAMSLLIFLMINLDKERRK